ncbi:hypothetical protein LY90DRAFT_514473 [Neocallimastix californiae]|uniref:CSN8/PSMD8/EIF3K domain-containing protein n=1 Tax=Neocallimastix californiae TaxID=1754190 RepID=A0A1Y2AR89_9FUNG|nr:hypothetical protein LY90DRAFT_514473 [Neocallimastix californiae]|eukprot:ORY24737.1 hypothetical protein LY90DRAFT_514473 [Neocallimastix californiae]
MYFGKTFGIEKYDIMEKFCEEIEMSFSILNNGNVKSDEYFEYLNSIKFDLMEDYRNSILGNANIELSNLNSPIDTMDIDDNQKGNVTKLLEESSIVEPSNLEVFSNPVYNTNFYIIFILVLIINNQMDSARYLYRRLPTPILKNRTLVFIKIFLSSMLKKNVGNAIFVLNKEIENEIKKENESIEKEEDLIEEDLMDKVPKVNKKNVYKNKGEKMDIYNKSYEVAGPSKGKIIENNTPEHSSDNIIDIPQQQYNTPEEQMKDIEYEDEEEEEEEEEDDDDDENDSDEGNNNNEINLKNSALKQIINDTMTPIDTETPQSYDASVENEVPTSSTTTNTTPDTNKKYFKIKRCSLFIKELLICLLDKTRKRQINLIAKAYDHIFVKEVAKCLNYSEENVITYLCENYGWKVEPAQDIPNEMVFIPKREVKEKKQAMSINHIDTLINHLIYLEDSDKIQKIKYF